MGPDSKRATYDDLLALPEGTRAEIIAGQLETGLPRAGIAQKYN